MSSTLTLEGDATTGGVPPGVDVVDTEEPDRPKRFRPQFPERREVGPAGDITAIIALLLLGFILTITVIAPLRQARDQQVLYSQLRKDLANATAPVSQVDFN